MEGTQAVTNRPKENKQQPKRPRRGQRQKTNPKPTAHPETLKQNFACAKRGPDPAATPRLPRGSSAATPWLPRGYTACHPAATLWLPRLLPRGYPTATPRATPWLPRSPVRLPRGNREVVIGVTAE